MVSIHSHVGKQQVSGESRHDKNVKDVAVECMPHNCSNVDYMEQNNEFDLWESNYSDDMSKDQDQEVALPEIDDDVVDNDYYNLTWQSDKSYDELCWDSQSKTGMVCRDAGVVAVKQA